MNNTIMHEDTLDYTLIGQRIRRYRRAHRLSQEQLAERIGISVAHMSHIETGNTKLSLSVLVKIALALDVQTDDLLTEARSGRSQTLDQLSALLEGCTEAEMRVIYDLAKTAKVSIEKHIAT